MSSFDASPLGLWAGRPAEIDDSEPVAKIKLLNRQDVVYPGQQTPIIIPRAHGFLSNGHLMFDVAMTFPYQEPPQPTEHRNIIGLQNFISGNAFTAPFNNTNPALNGHTVNGYMNNAGVQALYAANTYPAPNPLFNTFSSQASVIAYSYPDYAIDPPRNLGHLVHLDRIVLEQSNGVIIYERSAATSWDGIIAQTLGTKTKADFFAADLMMGTQIAQNAPGIDPFLVPPPYTRGTRRANSIQISPDRSTITFVKEVNMPLPFPGLQNMPVQFMSDGDLNVQITFAPNVSQQLVAEQMFFTGTINLFQDSEMAYAGSMDILSKAITSVAPYGAQTTFSVSAGVVIPPVIENCKIMPIIPNAPCAGSGISVTTTPRPSEYFPGLTASRGYEQSVLQVTLNGVFLDTDLSDILGDPTLIDPIGYPAHPNLTGASPSYPASSIRNNGILLKFRLSKMDIPFCSGSGTGFQAFQSVYPRDGFSQNLENDYDYFYGHSVKRDMWVSHYVHASFIQEISLRHRHVIAPVVSDPNSQSYLTSGVTVSDNELGSKGQVFIQFTNPQVINIPLYGINACSTTFMSNIPAAGPVPPTVPTVTAFHSLMSCSHTDTSIDLHWATGLFAQNWELNVVGITNAWGFYGKTDSPNIPVIPQQFAAYSIANFATQSAAAALAADCPVSKLTALTDPCYSTPYNSANLTLPSCPVYMQPTSVTYSNLAITFDQPKLAQKYIDAMYEMYADSTTGLGITFVEMTRLVWPMQDQGYITWQTSPRQIYALRLGMRCSLNPLPFGVRPYIPLTSFANYELTQGGVQVKVADAAWAAQVLGNAWPVQRTNLNTPNQLQPTAFLKGSAGNAYFQQQIDISIGNCYNRTDLSTGEPAFAVNMSYFNFVRATWDIWYSMNTHGGAATIPVFTQWQLRYSLANAMEVKEVYPIQILRDTSTASAGYPLTTDPFASSGYAASQTYHVQIQQQAPTQATNMGSWGYPQSNSSIVNYSHYTWDMGFGAGTANIGQLATVPTQNGAIYNIRQPAYNAPNGAVTYGYQSFKQFDDNLLWNPSSTLPFSLEVQIYHRRRITFYQGKAASTGADIGLFVSTN
jgi:hypothetical protein